MAAHWKGGRVRKNCRTCGAETWTHRSWLKKNGGDFCSRHCQAIYRIKHTKKRDTSIEIALEKMLISIGVKYEKQKMLPEGRTVADFYITEQRLVLYADGKYWHKSEDARGKGIPKKDATQDLLLGLHGYGVLRLGEDEINNNESACMRKIRKAIQ